MRFKIFLLSFLFLFSLSGCSKLQPVVGDRTSNFWQSTSGTFISLIGNGYDILINGVNRYLNFNSISGSSGYGIRDNSGTIEYKNSGGSWKSISSGSGGGIALTDLSNTVTGENYSTTTGVTSLVSGYVIPLTASTSQWQTAYGWGNHAGLYDLLGQATSTLNSHLSTYNHDNFNTAYVDRLKWDGGSSSLNAATGRSSLGLGSMALESNTGTNTINTVGTISSGIWQGTTIKNTYIASSSYWKGYQDFSASNPITYNNNTGAIGWTNSNNYITLGSISANSPISYNNGTGVFSVSANYSIPLTASTTEWANKQNALTFPLATNLGGTGSTSLSMYLLPVDTIGGVATTTNLHEAYRQFWSSGVLYGADITDNGNGTVNLSASEAELRSSSSSFSPLYTVAVPAQNNIGLTDNSSNYIYADYNGGSPKYGTTTSITGFNCQDKCLAWAVSREGNTLNIVDFRYQNVDFSKKYRRLLLDVSPFQHAQGGSVLSSPSSLYLAETSGKYYYGFSAVDQIAFDTSVGGTANANVFQYYWRNGSGGWNSVTGQKLLDNNGYDNNSGATTSLTLLHYKVDWVYNILSNPARLAVVYSQADYTTLSGAQAATPPSSLPASLSETGYLIGRVIIQKSAATPTEIDSSFTTTFNPSVASNHNDLAGIQGGGAGEYYHLTLAQYNNYPNLITLSSLSNTATGLTYNNNTGVTSLTSGYSIPLFASTTNWETSYADRFKWDGSSSGLVPATGRTSLGLGSMAIEANTGTSTITTLGTISTGIWNAGSLTSSGQLTVNGAGDNLINGPLEIASTTHYPSSILTMTSSSPSYLQAVLNNVSNTSSSSADYVVGNSLSTDSSYYTDFGQNSSGFSQANWTINGANDGYLYTSDSNLSVGVASSTSYLNFFTGGTLISNERMRITSSGLVGIGTTTPSDTLTVLGNFNLSGAFKDSSKATGTSGQFLSSTGTSTQWVNITGGGDMLKANNLSDVASSSVAANNLGNPWGSIDGQVPFWNASTNKWDKGTTLNFASATQDLMIGTTTDSGFSLDIFDNNKNLLRLLQGSSTQYARIDYCVIGGRCFTSGVGGPSEATYGLANDFYVFDYTASATRLVIDSTGNLGIGTSAPSQMLTVGATTSSQFLVNNSGAIVGLTGISGVSGTMDFTGAGVFKITNSGTLVTNSAGSIGIDTTSNQFRYYGTATSTLSPILTPSFTLASTTLYGGAATSTIPLGPAGYNETWSSALCNSNGASGVGTTTLRFGNNTTWTNTLTVTSTPYNLTLSSNNAFPLATTRFVQVITTAGSPNYISCTIRKTIDPD